MGVRNARPYSYATSASSAAVADSRRRRSDFAHLASKHRGSVACVPVVVLVQSADRCCPLRCPRPLFLDFIPLFTLSLMRALIFAAGLGTRLRPLTDRMPKALVPVDGQPLLWHTIHRLVEVGAEELVVNVHHFGQQIIDYLAEHEWPVPIHVSDEREALLDTGGGLRRAIPLFAERDAPILIHNVDILSDAPLRAFYAESADVDVQLMVSRRDTQRYLLFDERMRLVGWTNVATGEVRSPHADLDVNACRKLAFSGIHCVSPRLREAMAGYPPAFPIMQFYLEQCDRLNIRGYEVEHLHLLDVGKVQTLAVAEDFVRKTLPSEL